MIKGVWSKLIRGFKMEGLGNPIQQTAKKLGMLESLISLRQLIMDMIARLKSTSILLTLVTTSRSKDLRSRPLRSTMIKMESLLSIL